MAKSKQEQNLTRVQRINAAAQGINAKLAEARGASDVALVALSNDPGNPEQQAAVAALESEVAGYEKDKQRNERLRAAAAADDNQTAKAGALKDLKAQAKDFRPALAAVLDAQSQKDVAVKALADAEAVEAAAVAHAKDLGWDILQAAYRDNPRHGEHAAGVFAQIGRAGRNPYAAEQTVKRAVEHFEQQVLGIPAKSRFSAGQWVSIGDGVEVQLTEKSGIVGVEVQATELGDYGGRKRPGVNFFMVADRLAVTEDGVKLASWVIPTGKTRGGAKTDEPAEPVKPKAPTMKERSIAAARAAKADDDGEVDLA